jgi:hypothetical protein
VSDTISAHPDPDRAARAARLVEEEIASRKRMLRFYLAALLIPIAVGVYILMSGSRDANEHRQDDARLRDLAEQVGEVQPAIERLNSLDTAALARASSGIARQEETVRELQRRQREIEQLVTRPAGPAGTRDSTTQSMLIASRRIDSLSQRVIAQQREIAQQELRIQRLQRGQDSVRAEVRAIRTRPQLDANLIDRLSRLERSNDSLRTTIRSGAARVRPPTR